VSQLCKRTHPKSLSWKERDFFPLLFIREGGKGDELFNLFITTQPQNESLYRENQYRSSRYASLLEDRFDMDFEKLKAEA
jgi:hypothetical protein